MIWTLGKRVPPKPVQPNIWDGLAFLTTVGEVHGMIVHGVQYSQVLYCSV